MVFAFGQQYIPIFSFVFLQFSNKWNVCKNEELRLNPLTVELVNQRITSDDFTENINVLLKKEEENFVCIDIK